jgi:hypothetical protein
MAAQCSGRPSCNIAPLGTQQQNLHTPHGHPPVKLFHGQHKVAALACAELSVVIGHGRVLSKLGHVCHFHLPPFPRPLVSQQSFHRQHCAARTHFRTGGWLEEEETMDFSSSGMGDPAFS